MAVLVGIDGIGDQTGAMRVVVTGSTGFIGSHLVPALRARGDEVVRLVRAQPRAGDEARWDPRSGRLDLDALRGVDAAVHLAGAGLGDRRWTSAYKREIRASRVDGTRTLATALAALHPAPRVLVSASAIGYYGDTGDRVIDESAPRGAGFLAEVVEAWEAAAEPAVGAGIRVVHPRTGIVIGADGGSWQRLLPVFRLGLGGRIGDGRQYWSFVSIDDEVRALLHLIDDASLSGPVNVTAPNPVTNAELTRAAGQVLHRPAVLPVPAFALRAALGEFAGDILGGQRVLPRRLEDTGFVFRHPLVNDALRAASPHRSA